MKEHIIFPPEWAPQDMIQLTWPHAGTDWRDCLDEINETYAAMADAITRREKLLIVSPEPEQVRLFLRNKLTEQQLGNITFFNCPTNDTWARDHGFITLTGTDGRLVRLDFKFNGWGEKFTSNLDNKINRRLFDAGIINGEYEDHLDFVLEGGSIESDGCGTVLTTSQCLLAPHRNQPLTRPEIEQRLKQYLHAERVLWLDHGNLVGDDTDGHIDTTVRFAPGDTLIYTGCDDASDCQYDDFKAMEEQLKTFRTPAGKPYHLLRLPMPDPVYYDGERLPATYANFLIINGAVLLPVYNQKDKDEEAANILSKAFPGREVVPIDSRVIVRQHGSVHCCAMQYPLAIKIKN